MLLHQRINCHIHMETDPAALPWPSHSGGSQSLMVHYSQLSEAWSLIEAAEERFLRSIACPICHAHKLKLITITKPHACRLAAIVSMLLNGKSIEIKRYYSCEGCGFDFDHF